MNSKQNKTKINQPLVPKAEKNAFPIRGNIESDNDATELVVFQEAQTLPLFVFFTD